MISVAFGVVLAKVVLGFPPCPSCGPLPPQPVDVLSDAGLAQGRGTHTATLLPNGKVLIAGGTQDPNAGSALSSTEIYDPAFGTWSDGGTLSNPRLWHTALLLPNGKVLVYGGTSSAGNLSCLSSGELYDPATGAWTSPLSSVTPTARCEHTATLMNNGVVLIAGGISQTGSTVPGLATVDLYDPATNAWTPSPGNPLMKQGRYGHTAQLMLDGGILITGGKPLTGGGPTYDTEVLTPSGFVDAGVLWRAVDDHSGTTLWTGQALVVGGQGDGGAGIADDYLPWVQLWDPAVGWDAGPPIENGSGQVGRSRSTATLLPFGQVVVATGQDPNGNQIPTVKVFDPDAGAWFDAGTMAINRGVATATLLPSGKILVVGGFLADGGVTDTYEELDFAQDSWTPSTWSLRTGRYGHTATLLADGETLVCGGKSASGSVLATCERDGFLAQPATMMTPRAGHTATLLPSGAVLVAGGANGGVAQATAELFTGTDLARTGALGTARTLAAASLLDNGTVLVSGGNDGRNAVFDSAEIYEPRTGTWASTGNMHDARFGHTSTLLFDGRVLVVGGDGVSGLLGTAEVYDPAQRRWSTAGSLAFARDSFTATLLPNHKVLVVGGKGLNGAIPDAELYDPATNQWSLAGRSTGRMDHTATLMIDGKVLVFSGTPDRATYLTSYQLYDTETGQWLPETPLGANIGQRGLAAAVLRPDGQVQIVGGTTGGNALGDAVFYDDRSLSSGALVAPRPGTPFIGGPYYPSGAIIVYSSGLMGRPEGSYGSFRSSPTNYPLFFLRRLDNQSQGFGLVTGWSSGAATVVLPQSLRSGHYLGWVLVSSVPSFGQSFIVSTADASKLAITSPAHTTPVGVCSLKVTVEAENSYGAANPVTQAVTLDLTSTSATGLFFGDSACATGISTLGLAAGQSQANFYYLDTDAGNPTLTVADRTSSLGVVTQQQTTFVPAPDAGSDGGTTLADAGSPALDAGSNPDGGTSPGKLRVNLGCSSSTAGSPAIVGAWLLSGILLRRRGARANRRRG